MPISEMPKMLPGERLGEIQARANGWNYERSVVWEGVGCEVLGHIQAQADALAQAREAWVIIRYYLTSIEEVYSPIGKVIHGDIWQQMDAALAEQP